MEQREFIKIYNRLGAKCQAVLREKLAQKSNGAIAQTLGISEATVRQHLTIAYRAFGLQTEERSARWPQLQMFFVQLMPELIPSPPLASFQPLSRWVGRSPEIAKLQQSIAENHKILILGGVGGIGKTELARQFLANCEFEKLLDLKIALDPVNVQSAEGVVHCWLKREFHEDVPSEFGLSLSLLEDKLRQFKVAILIDNLESALSNGQFLPHFRNYVELLRVLSEPRIKGFTLITSR